MKAYTKIFLLTLALFTSNFVINAQIPSSEKTHEVEQAQEQAVSTFQNTEATEATVYAQTPLEDLQKVIDDAKAVINSLPKEVNTLADVDLWESLIYAVIFLILGYISPFIPGLNKITDTWKRVAAAGIALTLGITVFKGTLPVSDIIQYVIGFILSSGLIYPAITKNIAQTKKVRKPSAVSA